MLPIPDPFSAFTDWWRWSARLQEALAAMRLAAPAILRLQAQRVAALVAYAREHSKYYRARMAGLPPGALPLAGLPVQTKAELMARFDDWVTDPAIRLDEVQRFIADPSRVSEPYLGRYAVWTSSGSTGRPGVYVQDDESLAVYDALLSARFPSAGAAPSPFATLATGGRFALVAALGGHFAGVVSWERLRRRHPWMAMCTRSFSVLAPLHELVAELEAWRPSVIASYPTTLLLLASERRAGRLTVRPQALWSGGETLADAERAEISAAFDCPVIDGYGASECMQIAFDCGCGALHLNSDWVVLEPVDEHGRPVPAGLPSATVLLTNLANRVQPLLRYDLGDSVVMLDEPCACGSPFPALHVSGRRDDILRLVGDDGRERRLAPLAVATVVEEDGGIHRFQVIQTGPRHLSVRFETPAGATRVAAMARIVGALRAWLARQGLAGVEIEEDPEPPRADPVSGKLREVLGLREPGRHESRPGEPARRRRGHHDPGPRESGPQAAPAPTRQRNRKPPAKGANTR
jgi:phenylacetate-coenzyme A ligase PaaK-like adenylate-forming protein